jgi:hypothetical protein
MMCGVEHDYIINPLDKLSCFPGFKSHHSNEQFASQLARIGGAIVAQDEKLAPADAKFYELRKETGTIPESPAHHRQRAFAQTRGRFRRPRDRREVGQRLLHQGS